MDYENKPDHDVLILVAQNVGQIVSHLERLNGTVAENVRQIGDINASREAAWGAYRRETDSMIARNCDEHERIQDEIKELKQENTTAHQGITDMLNNIQIKLTFRQLCIIILLVTTIAVGGSVGADQILEAIP